jgi:hypothetical protein
MQFLVAGHRWQCFRVGDGTLDTLIEVQPISLKRNGGKPLKAQTIRFSQEYASQIFTRKGRVIQNRLTQLCREAVEAYDAQELD